MMPEYAFSIVPSISFAAAGSCTALQAFSSNSATHNGPPITVYPLSLITPQPLTPGTLPGLSTTCSTVWQSTQWTGTE
uniref:Uncharacterized protein n=1 Tax=Physcomitrium patens TaxID=3218 RepID=A0A2K1J9U5_PHYPA|nr:hypothetical protein PHYPA_021421 [Physcomitrium patens]